MDMTDTIEPKSDQLSADDLIGRTLTITVTKVSIPGGEQPVSISFEGDNGRPFRPGKSMRRVLVHVWGPDANAYVGRSMTLYRDDEVVFGGLKVGGIRISHMSHTEKAQTMALTATRGNKKAFTIKPLAVAKAQRDVLREGADRIKARLADAQDQEALDAVYADPKVKGFRDRIREERPDLDTELTMAEDDARYRITAGDPGDAAEPEQAAA